MPILPGFDRLPDGTLAAAIKQVPATREPEPVVPKLLDELVNDFMDGTGHDTELAQHLA